MPPSLRRVTAGLLIAGGWAAAAGHAAGNEPPPGAYELLQRIRERYSSLTAYHDRGRVERVVRSGQSETRTELHFETAYERDGRFRWRLEAGQGEERVERVVWRQGSRMLASDSALGQVKPVRSLVGEVLDSIGEGGFEALVVPGLLAGGDAVLADPEGASVEGPVACGSSRCWLLSLSRMAGSITTQLWLESERHLVRRVVVELTPPSPGPGPASRQTITVHHEPEVVDGPVAEAALAFAPPPDAREVKGWETEGASESDLPSLGFSDEITVEQMIVVVRAVDRSGDPIRGLGPDDFVVRAKGHAVPVVAVDWVSSEEPLTAGIPVEDLDAAGVRRPPPGKLIVFFLQADTNAVRIKGHIRLVPLTRELVRGLHPDDRIAVVTFDSHLKLWHDFTRDHERIASLLDQAFRFGGSPLVRRSGRVALADHLDLAEARRVTRPDEALRLVAEALRRLPGDKDVVYVGWGLGEYWAGAVRMSQDYSAAISALESAQASVFVLDVTYADYHTLEIGLQRVAEQTGGTYARTFRFPQQAVHRLARTLGGRYLLTLDLSGIPPRGQEVRVELRDGPGRVLHRPTYLQ